MSDEEEKKNRKRKYVKQKQKYRKEWQDSFKWLSADKTNEFKAFCKPCRSSMKADISVVKHHEGSNIHRRNIQGSQGQSNIANFVKKNVAVDLQVQDAELKLAGFFVEHNIPFVNADHLVKLLKDVTPDSEIMKKVQLGRTKLTSIVKNVIGVEHKKELAEKLKVHKFSVLTDESTDIICEKTSCIVVRYVEHY